MIKLFGAKVRQDTIEPVEALANQGRNGYPAAGPARAIKMNRGIPP